MRQDKTRLYGGVAAAVLIAGVGGFGLAKITAKPAAPVAAEAEAEHKEGEVDAVEMAPEAIKATGILVQPVSVGGFAGEVLAQATVTASPTGQAVLTARTGGAVTRIYKRLGDPVRAGERQRV